MKAFVAGGDGCVGHALSRMLGRHGQDVAAASRPPYMKQQPMDADTAVVDYTSFFMRLSTLYECLGSGVTP